MNSTIARTTRSRYGGKPGVGGSGHPGELTTPPDRSQQRVDRLPLVRRILRHRRQHRHRDSRSSRVGAGTVSVTQPGQIRVGHAAERLAAERLAAERLAAEQSVGNLRWAVAVDQARPGSRVDDGIPTGRRPGRQEPVDDVRIRQRQQDSHGGPVGAPTIVTGLSRFARCSRRAASSTSHPLARRGRSGASTSIPAAVSPTVIPGVPQKASASMASQRPPWTRTTDALIRGGAEPR